MYQNSKELLSKLENLISLGILTKASHVDSETFVCFTEIMPQGKTYHQFIFEQLPSEFRSLFLHRTTGEAFDRFKIVEVFDIWPDHVQMSPAKPVRRAA